MRLSVMYREPLDRVMQWPASHVQLIAAYLKREPMADERIEIAIAQLTAIYMNAHKKKTSVATKVSDVLLFRKPWDAPKAEASGRYSALDLEIMAAMK